MDTYIVMKDLEFNSELEHLHGGNQNNNFDQSVLYEQDFLFSQKIHKWFRSQRRNHSFYSPSDQTIYLTIAI